mgnify:FL=1
MDTHTYKGQLKVNVNGCSRSTTGQWQQKLKVNYRSMSTTAQGQLQVNVNNSSRSTKGQCQQQLKVNYRSMSTAAQGQLQVNVNGCSRSTTGQCQQLLKVNCRLRSTLGQSKLHKLIIYFIQYRNKQKQEVQFEGYMENCRSYLLISHIHYVHVLTPVFCSTLSLHACSSKRKCFHMITKFFI